MTDRTHPDSGRIITSGDVIAELQDRIAELEAQLAPTHAQIAAYLKATGAYVTNDATREAAIADAISADRAARAPADSVLEDAETALRKVLEVVQRYLPPDGTSAHDAMSEITAIVDPWPLGPLEKS